MSEKQSSTPACKFAINQRVKTKVGEGTVQGCFYEEGAYRVIVLHDKTVVPEETVPETRGWVLYYYTEDELEAID